MQIKDIITSAIKEVASSQERFQLGDVLKVLDGQRVSRQYVSRIVAEEVTMKRLISSGSTRYTYYALPENIDSIREKHSWEFQNNNLREYELYQDTVVATTPFLQTMPENTESILGYAFSEMLNNAIDHSKSEKISTTFYHEDGSVTFILRDQGIGVFESIRAKYKLKDALEAIQELLKGKTTTAPQMHSGEGIFFTSKIADRFVLDSHEMRLIIDNTIKDIFVESRPRALTGTKVTFTIKEKTKKHLSDIFREYQSNQEAMDFDRTVVHVKLYTMGTVYVSRSQARRILAGLAKKFKLVVMDFDKVPTIGQAFADEVFRVFTAAHPDVKIEAIHANEAVNFMINRAINTKR
ncbi:MAG TPA: DUF4325 domain-containing protein [Candidatus Saccharimonadales bacterium]|nr:DUF4325 domain-containing protein [Candidatus Saccharimonadales bacterium]